jgi:hypothetical protein
MLPGISPDSPPAAARGAKEGSFLVLCIVLVILMTMISIVVATSTKTELSVSSNTDNGRKAFIQADSALKISVLIARVLLFPSTGQLDQLLSPGSDLIIEANPDEFDLALMRWNYESTNYADRYLVAGARSTGIPLSGDSKRPLITFKRKHPTNPAQTRVVATSAVSLDFSESSMAGGSLGDISYGTDSAALRTIIIVTTDGRVPVGLDATASEEAAFFDGSADTTHAILTTAFQEVQ